MIARQRSQGGFLLMEVLLTAGATAVLIASLVTLYSFYSRALEGEVVSGEASRLVAGVGMLDFTNRDVGDDVTSVIAELLVGQPALFNDVDALTASIQLVGVERVVLVAFDLSADACNSAARGMLGFDVTVRVQPSGGSFQTVQLRDGAAAPVAAAAACGLTRARVEVSI